MRTEVLCRAVLVLSVSLWGAVAVPVSAAPRTSDPDPDPDPGSNALAPVEEGNRGGRLGGVGSTGAVVLGEIARELISRSATSSQVLSLNLTNLVILLVLKAIIFGAGTMGVGWAPKGRAAESLVTEQEALLLLGFLMGEERGAGAGAGAGQELPNYPCLNRVACQEPEAAYSYARAGTLLSKGARLLQGVIPYDDKYDDIVSGLSEAVEYGKSGGRCEARYSCSKR